MLARHCTDRSTYTVHTDYSQVCERSWLSLYIIFDDVSVSQIFFFSSFFLSPASVLAFAVQTGPTICRRTRSHSRSHHVI